MNEGKPFEFEKSKEEIKEEVLQWLYKEVKQPDKYLISIALGHAIRKTVERIKSSVQGLIQEIEKMENYAIKIQKEDLTEFMKGYWKGQQNLINELKRQIKKWFPDVCEEVGKDENKNRI